MNHTCRECGEPMAIGDDGVSNHLLYPYGGDEIDHDADGDHVAVADETPTEPSDEDYVTKDYIRWYEHGGKAIRDLVTAAPGDKGAMADDWNKQVQEHMNKNNFWPGAWFLGERGDWNLLDLETGRFAAETK